VSHLRIVFGMAAMLLMVGCHAARVQEPLTNKISGNDLGAQLAFWHELADRPVTCNDEAFHGLLLYIDDEDNAADYAARVSTLKSRGLLPPGFDRPADEAVTRGNLAIAIAKLLKVKGGLLMRATHGYVPRYATRELMFMNLYPPSSPHQTFTGSEFLGIIGRLEDWQRGQDPAAQPAAKLPGEM
jgi:hypothetical protein